MHESDTNIYSSQPLTTQVNDIIKSISHDSIYAPNNTSNPTSFPQTFNFGQTPSPPPYRFTFDQSVSPNPAITNRFTQSTFFEQNMNEVTDMNSINNFGEDMDEIMNVYENINQTTQMQNNNKKRCLSYNDVDCTPKKKRKI